MSKTTTPIFDVGSPYADLTPDVIKGYLRITVKGGHALADARGRVMAHRAVLYDSIGDGPHSCHWCEWDGLRWDVPRRDPDYLIVDHLGGDGFDERLEGLRATCAWCNDNRSVIERLGIPWSAFVGTPPSDRPPLRVTYNGEPTAAAYALAKQPVAEVVSFRTGEAVPLYEPASSRAGGWVTWDDVVDVAELARGNVRLRPPPAALQAAHPELRDIDWSRFGR